MSLTGRFALVTGAAQGIGKEILFRLASDGFHVALNDLEAKSELLASLIVDLNRKYPDLKFISCIGDVSVEDDVRQVFENVELTFGALDAMVANAAVCNVQSFLDVSISEIEKTFSVNFFGVFFCYQYAAKLMIKTGRKGRIVGACSLAGKQAIPSLSIYSSSKFAMRGLTQAVAAELGQHGITCNAYAPGYIITDMTAAIAAEKPDPELHKRNEAEKSAVKRNGQPSDIAAVVSFLVSPGSEFVTGQTIVVDGGRYFD